MEKIIKAGLCSGRHDIPVEGYIFGDIENVTDIAALNARAAEFVERHGLARGNGELHLYVTGLTVALVAVINICCLNGINLILYHFDRESGQYFPQPVETRVDCDFVLEGGYSGISSRC